MPKHLPARGAASAELPFALADILDSLPDAVVVVDERGRVVHANAQVGPIFGYSSAELQGSSVEILVPDRLRAMHRRERGRYRSKSEFRSMGAGLQLIGRRKDGTEFPADISLGPLPGPGGFTLATVRDETERRRAEGLAGMGAVAQAVRDGVLALDATGTVTRCNAALEVLTGYRADEIVGRPLRALASDSRREDLERAVGEVLAGTVIPEVEIRLRRKDGAVADALATLAPVPDPDGRPVGASVTIHDITERKRADEALARYSAHLVEAQAIGHVGSWHQDTETGSVTWSEELHRILGVQPEAVEPSFKPTLEGLLDHVHPAERQRIGDDIERVRASGEPCEHEYRVVRPGGEVRWIRARVVLDVFDERRAELHGVCHDATERHEVEERARILSEMVTDVAYSIRFVGDMAVLEWTSAAFTRLLDMTASEIDTRGGWRSIVHPDDLPIAERHVAALRRGKPDVSEIRVVTASGDVRWFEVHGQPQLGDSTGLFDRAYGAAHDVTDRKLAEEEIQAAYERERAAAEQLREANRLKDDFVSVVSHELRAPLASIIGFASLLAKQPGTEETDRATLIEPLKRNSLEMARMIERLLDWSRLEGGAFTVDPQPVGLRAVILECIERASSFLEAHHMLVAVPDDVEVQADPDALGHVIVNLLTNAAKFSAPGSTVGVSAETDGDASVVVSVSDEGIGMSKETREHLFDRFYQGPDQPAGTRGTGIGLAIARSYVDLMGGDIAVESELGKGSTVTVTLPVAAPSPPGPRPSSSRTDGPSRERDAG